MAKKPTERLEAGVTSLRPYVENAFKDEEFREHLREAFKTAQGIYGDLSKEPSLGKSARKLATSKDVQTSVRRAIEELNGAADTLQSKGKHKGARQRKVLLAGIVVGALYNPWTGAQTRKWLLDKIAGDDELAPLAVDVSEPVPAGAGVGSNGGDGA
jgi:hypothetical protein